MAALSQPDSLLTLRLAQVTQQAINYAVRTGITVGSTFALRQCGKLLKVRGPHQEVTS